MASFSMSGKGNVNETVRILTNGILQSGLSCELVDSVRKTYGSMEFCVMVFEKYYMRAENRVSLTVIVSGTGDDVAVEAIGSGGGRGPLFSFSWGAEDDFVGTVVDVLKDAGFC
ncbi:MAG: DUF6054 family protein [Saccharofermentanales bacterium]